MGEAARRLDADPRADLRSAPRESVHVQVDVFSEHNFWSGLSMNMSEGGVFVATHHVVPHGTRVMLNLLLPFEDEPIVLVAEVRWTRGYSGQDDVPPGLGLQFIDLDEHSHARIRRFVNTTREPLYFDD